MSSTNVDGVLAVSMSVLDDHGHVLKTWTLSDATDTIGDTGVVGGNRYAWLVNNDFDGLALDNDSDPEGQALRTAL